VRRVSVPTDLVAIIGAGQSALVAHLIDGGYRQLVAVDISGIALECLRASLAVTDAVTFVQADVRSVTFERSVDVWHDRATLHFLTDPADRIAYARRAAAAVRPGGYLVLAEFAPDGPSQCSGLRVERHDALSLAALFGDAFTVVDTFERGHITPSGAEQRFLHALLQRRTAHIARGRVSVDGAAG